ncbi:TetR/AcrR family transcriptional regulator [Nocardioides alcanivorans]|uniref:TetR/AcrR family transcriptional regulator n=1 Tax=Nocardioides alcanivorans TaxID=2897352 RepID=UPI001F35F1EE|nr:helix-turn-helix domain-containing protein [Nocardioides alcanivorans]
MIPAEDKPRGPKQVRHAILTAAHTRFAEKGFSASLREIAADAGVNLGLIHKYVGNKEELIREILRRDLKVGAVLIKRETTLPELLRRMFLTGVADPAYVRITAWLTLEGRTDLLRQEQPGSMALIQAAEPSSKGDIRLTTALAAVYGWSLFSSEILFFAGIPDEQKEEVEQRMADLLASLVDREEGAAEGSGAQAPTGP